MTAPFKFPRIADVLQELGVRLDKRRGQHFLKRQEICAAIAELARMTPRHTAVEVGAGLGNLSVELAARAGRVVSIEVDDEFLVWHRHLMAHRRNLLILNRDFLDVSLEALIAEHSLGGPIVGAGNLPYQITSAILFKFVDSPLPWERLVFMMQREVAERIAAGPATRDSGALTYKIALRFAPRIALAIPPGEFLPPPAVHSSVLVLEPLPAPLYRDDAHRRRLYALLDKLFAHRRKTFSNIMTMSAIVPDRPAGLAALSAAGIDPMRRPETLQLSEVIALDKALP